MIAINNNRTAGLQHYTVWCSYELRCMLHVLPNEKDCTSLPAVLGCAQLVKFSKSGFPCRARCPLKLHMYIHTQHIHVYIYIYIYIYTYVYYIYIYIYLHTMYACTHMRTYAHIIVYLVVLDLNAYLFMKAALTTIIIIILVIIIRVEQMVV